jgi:drug/metabolite transporter (DMT)-like permease
MSSSGGRRIIGHAHSRSAGAQIDGTPGPAWCTDILSPRAPPVEPAADASTLAWEIVLSSLAPERKPVDATAASLTVALCFLWGFTHVVAKLTAPYMPLVLQAGVRSAIATALLLVWARTRGIPLFERDGTLGPGLVAGALFAGEFLFIFAGLGHTAASRIVVFIYLAPCLTALGLHLFLPSERLSAGQWMGVLLAFIGIAVAFGDGFLHGQASWIGDAFGVIGATLWAATTVVIRTTRLTSTSATKTLFYQIAVSAATLPIASALIGERTDVVWNAAVIASLLYQGAVVTFASYLIWFWLLTRYLAGRLSIFTFLTPLFGVAAGVVLLHEPFTATFAAAVGLVGAGIYLVNRRPGLP